MNLYAIFLGIDCLILMLCLLLPFVSRNQVFGLRIYATLSDSEIWKKSQIRASKLIGYPAVLFASINGLLFFIGYPEKYAKFIEEIFFLYLVLASPYLIYYANSLYEQRFPGKVKMKSPFKSPTLNRLWNFARKLNPFFVGLKDIWV